MVGMVLSVLACGAQGGPSATTLPAVMDGGPSETDMDTPVQSSTQSDQIASPCGISLQALVDAAPPGSWVEVPACLYREMVTITKPLTLAADPGAEIRGSDVWTGWNPQGGRWVSELTVPRFPPINADSCGGGRCALPEQVYLDGTALTQVTGAPNSGQFALDSGRHVVLADNPTGRLVEVTTRVRWITGQASNVTIQGFLMQHAANDPLDGGINIGGTNSNWTIQDNRLFWAHGSIIDGGEDPATGSGHRILRNEIAYGGDFGIINAGQNGLIQGNNIHHNAIEGFNCAWGCGGVKATQQGLTLDANEVHHNLGPGLWLDIHANNATITNNRVHHNRDVGILFEISDGARITDNVVWNNGQTSSRWGWGGGIVISSSANAEVARNTLAWNADGIVVISQPRDDAPAGGVVGVYVHDNIILQQDDTRVPGERFALAFLQESHGQMFASGANNRGEANRFWYANAESRVYRFAWDRGYSRLADFKNTPGGRASDYLSAAERDQVLLTAGIG